MDTRGAERHHHVVQLTIVLVSTRDAEADGFVPGDGGTHVGGMERHGESLHRFGEPLERHRRHRRRCFRARALEQPDGLPVASKHGNRQRRSPSVVSGVDIGAELDEARQDSFPARAAQPMTSPLDVATPLDVRGSIEQQSNALEVSPSGGDVQRRGVVADVARIRVRTAVEQQPHCLGMAHRLMQPAAPRRIALTYQTDIEVEQSAQRLDFSSRTRPKEFHKERRAFRAFGSRHSTFGEAPP